MAEPLRIKELSEIPTVEEFESQFEPLNLPIVIRGCVKDWKAFDRWNPINGGLPYLQERVGSAVVDVMLSRCAPVFYGDIRSHERVPLPFSSFIGMCKRECSNHNDNNAISQESDMHQNETVVTDFCSSHEQIYLAQVPILSRENEERVQLESLREDIKVPSFLKSKLLSSINLWMNNAQSRSSTHYDPHNNLLCVIAGCKKVILWPPSASPMLYPMPIYGEASNHSSVALDSPDFSMYPRFKHACDHFQQVVLQSGDALFLPEGWYHQVDSDELTIAVNFWWRSNVMSSMSEHMDVYYLRRILRRLIDKEMNQMLPKTSVTVSDKLRDRTLEISCQAGTDSHENRMCKNSKDKLNVDLKLHDLGPQALQTLRELVSLVHAGVSVSNQQDQCTLARDSEVDEGSENVTSKQYSLTDDSVAHILWNLDPLTLQAILLAMAHNFPRTLEALILHMLSPVGAEVLTRKFDELDQQMTEEDRNTFYQKFYSVFDDQSSAMEAILNGKESFALQAYKNVLQLYMGITFDGSSYSFR